MRRCLPWILSLLVGATTPVRADDFSVELGGRIHLDAVRFDGGSSETGTRRARLALSGQVRERWRYKLQFEFSNTAGGVVDMKDLYVSDSRSGLLVGQFKTPLSLEEQESSNTMTFIERGLPSAMVTSRRLGVGWEHHEDTWSLATAVYGSTIDDRRQGRGHGARVTFAPVRDDDDVLHLGGALLIERPENDRVRFRARPEVHLGPRVIDSGLLDSVDEVRKSGLELAWQHRNWLAQGEYIRADVRREDLVDARVSGHYFYLSWFPGGERLSYGKGKFGRIRMGAEGTAWQFALRRSRLAVDDGMAREGALENWTLAANWYLRPNVRLMFDHVRAELDQGGTRRDFDTLHARFQWDF